MTINANTPVAASAQTTDIENVDTFAIRLYRRARASGQEFTKVALAVRGLHTVLKHLKVETEDPSSLLNSDDQNSVYARQLTAMIEDSDFTLKQLETVLEKYGGNSSGSDQEGRIGGLDGQRIGARERDMIGLLRNKFDEQKLNIDMFLDTVQLYNPSKSHRVVDTNNVDLDSIKDKVDAIAARITQRKDSASADGDDELWLQFRDELEKEGFSRDVLRQNQDVLRAYIRQLDEQSIASGKTPTVRGFLEGYQPRDDGLPLAPYPDYAAPVQAGEPNPKEMSPRMDNEKFFPSMKTERLRPEQYPPYPLSLVSQSTDVSYDQRSSDDGDESSSTSSQSMALVISTRDLMAFDYRRQADLTHAMDNMHLQASPYGGAPYNTHDSVLSSSPQTRFLPPPPNAGLLASSPTHSIDQFGVSPQFVPIMPPPPYGSSPPPALHFNSVSAPAIPGGPVPNAGGQGAQRCARLAPDSQGREIPLDAQWTRVKRSLISLEVLIQAGVRFEARPDFVAILGRISKDEIAEFARLSAEVRRKRRAAHQDRREQRDEKDRYYQDKYKNWDVEADGKSGDSRRRANSEFSSSSTDLCDSSDESDEEPPAYRSRGDNHVYPDEKKNGHDEEEKGTKSYPFIVSPPEKEKGDGSPAATVKPKPILKNKNDDPHVRFDPEPQNLEESGRSHHRRSERSHHGDRSDRDRYTPRSYDDRRDRDRDRERERDRDRDRDDDGSSSRRHRRYHGVDGSRRRDYDRDRDDYSSRRRRDRSEERSAKKKARGETLRAVGIGGAAASLLSVLTEAAGNF